MCGVCSYGHSFFLPPRSRVVLILIIIHPARCLFSSSIPTPPPHCAQVHTLLDDAELEEIVALRLEVDAGKGKAKTKESGSIPGPLRHCLWHPSGQYLAFSAGTQVFMLHLPSLLPQLLLANNNKKVTMTLAELAAMKTGVSVMTCSGDRDDQTVTAMAFSKAEAGQAEDEEDAESLLAVGLANGYVHLFTVDDGQRRHSFRAAGAAVSAIMPVGSGYVIATEQNTKFSTWKRVVVTSTHSPHQYQRMHSLSLDWTNQKVERQRYGVLLWDRGARNLFVWPSERTKAVVLHVAQNTMEFVPVKLVAFPENVRHPALSCSLIKQQQQQQQQQPKDGSAGRGRRRAYTVLTKAIVRMDVPTLAGATAAAGDGEIQMLKAAAYPMEDFPLDSSTSEESDEVEPVVVAMEAKEVSATRELCSTLVQEAMEFAAAAEHQQQQQRQQEEDVAMAAITAALLTKASADAATAAANDDDDGSEDVESAPALSRNDDLEKAMDASSLASSTGKSATMTMTTTTTPEAFAVAGDMTKLVESLMTKHRTFVFMMMVLCVCVCVNSPVSSSLIVVAAWEEKQQLREVAFMELLTESVLATLADKVPQAMDRALHKRMEKMEQAVTTAVANRMENSVQKAIQAVSSNNNHWAAG